MTRRYRYVRTRTTALGTEKQCNACLDWWPRDAEFFSRNPACPDGLQNYCRDCDASRVRRYYAARRAA